MCEMSAQLGYVGSYLCFWKTGQGGEGSSQTYGCCRGGSGSNNNKLRLRKLNTSKTLLCQIRLPRFHTVREFSFIRTHYHSQRVSKIRLLGLVGVKRWKARSSLLFWEKMREIWGWGWDGWRVWRGSVVSFLQRTRVLFPAPLSVSS